MSETVSKVEVISGVARRRRFSTEVKLAVVAETMRPACRSAMLLADTGFRPAWYSVGGN
jgi:transposase